MGTNAAMTDATDPERPEGRKPDAPARADDDATEDQEEQAEDIGVAAQEHEQGDQPER